MTARVIRDSLNPSRIVVASILLLCARCVKIAAGIEAAIDLGVEGDGFHRTLIYRVNFKNITNDDCHAAIHLELPSALYVNVDEIAELRRRKMSTVCSVGETDVELFAERANRQNVTTCGQVSSSSCVLTIPVHQRYQYARETGGGYVGVTLPEPQLLLGCRGRVKGHRVSKTNLCEPCVGLATKWRQIPYRMSSNRNYVWSIPIGDSSLSALVACVTLSITIVGAIFIARAIHANASKSRQKKD